MHEIAPQNSGRMGGKYLSAQLVPRPLCNPNEPEYYSSKDFHIGALPKAALHWAVYSEGLSWLEDWEIFGFFHEFSLFSCISFILKAPFCTLTHAVSLSPARMWPPTSIWNRIRNFSRTKLWPVFESISWRRERWNPMKIWMHVSYLGQPNLLEFQEQILEKKNSRTHSQKKRKIWEQILKKNSMKMESSFKPCQDRGRSNQKSNHFSQWDICTLNKVSGNVLGQVHQTLCYQKNAESGRNPTNFEPQPKISARNNFIINSISVDARTQSTVWIGHYITVIYWINTHYHWNPLIIPWNRHVYGSIN